MLNEEDCDDHEFVTKTQLENLKKRAVQSGGLHISGAKDDAGKPRLGLVLGGFALALTEVGRIGTYGAQKYTDNGWKEVPNGIDRYTDAMLRHLFKPNSSFSADTESGLLDAAHAAWCALARLELVLQSVMAQRSAK